MDTLDDLLPLIDNGGLRSYVERRRSPYLPFIPERRSKEDRRKKVDRRKIPNQRRKEGPERRSVFKGFESLDK